MIFFGEIGDPERVTFDGDVIGGLRIAWTTESEAAQADILIEALQIFSERNAEYKDNWKRQGLRGSLFKLRLKVERIWDVWWATPVDAEDQAYRTDVDDLLDAINNAAFCVRAVRSGSRDGEWSYPS